MKIEIIETFNTKELACKKARKLNGYRRIYQVFMKNKKEWIVGMVLLPKEKSIVKEKNIHLTPKQKIQRRRREELLPLAIKEREKGRTSKEIAKELGVGYSTLRNWFSLEK